MVVAHEHGKDSHEDGHGEHDLDVLRKVFVVPEGLDEGVLLGEHGAIVGVDRKDFTVLDELNQLVLLDIDGTHDFFEEQIGAIGRECRINSLCLLTLNINALSVIGLFKRVRDHLCEHELASLVLLLSHILLVRWQVINFDPEVQEDQLAAYH